VDTLNSFANSRKYERVLGLKKNRISSLILVFDPMSPVSRLSKIKSLMSSITTLTCFDPKSQSLLLISTASSESLSKQAVAQIPFQQEFDIKSKWKRQALNVCFGAGRVERMQNLLLKSSPKAGNFLICNYMKGCGVFSPNPKILNVVE
jgi:hypothetical protein